MTRSHRNAPQQHQPQTHSVAHRPTETAQYGGPRIETLPPIPEAETFDTPVVTPDVPIITQAYDAGSAVDPEEIIEAPRAKRYTVTHGGLISDPSGFRVRMHEGKVVDDHNYDIARLRKQGIKLEPLLEDAS